MQDDEPDHPRVEQSAALPYRSAAADRAERHQRAGSRSSFAIGCLASILCVVLLIGISLSYQTRNWVAPAWITAGPALLALGVVFGTRRRDWGFFFGALASVILVLSFVGLLMAICR
jgi:predicted benzoate:H+ symporter BenE